MFQICIVIDIGGTLCFGHKGKSLRLPCKSLKILKSTSKMYPFSPSPFVFKILNEYYKAVVKHIEVE